MQVNKLSAQKVKTADARLTLATDLIKVDFDREHILLPCLETKAPNSVM